MTVLWIAFFIVALLYSSIGFGGGSSYIALMVLSGVSMQTLPVIALICNIIVVTGGCFHYYRSGQIEFRRALPFLLTSVPMAYVGGWLRTDEVFFQLLLALCLLFSGVVLLKNSTTTGLSGPVRFMPLWAASSVGACIGFISGMVGIGGGIFLSPLLHHCRWGAARQIAAMSSVFILANSLSGLSAHLMKRQDFSFLADSWPLFVAVLVGGQFGSMLSAYKLPQRIIMAVTSVLILYASMQLLNTVYRNSV